MKRPKVVTLFSALVLIAAHGAVAQTESIDVSGEWEFTWETPRGETMSTLLLTQDGSTFTGTAQMQRGEVAIENGIVDGNLISFVLVREMRGRSLELEFTGTVEGDTMLGTATTPRGEFEWTAKKIAT